MDANALPVPLAVASGSKNMAFARLAFRKSTAAQAIEAEDNPINPWTEAPRERTQEYFACLEKRRALPVAKTREDSINTYKEQQVIAYVGETGSGKSTQISQYV